jgi:hypothetical protein
MSGVSPPLAPQAHRNDDSRKFACCARRAMSASRPKNDTTDERSWNGDERRELGFLAFAARRDASHRDVPRHIAKSPGDVG